MKISTLWWVAVSAAMIAVVRFIFIEELAESYAVALGALTAFYVLFQAIDAKKRKRLEAVDPSTIDAFRSAQQIVAARRAVRDRVPRNAPRRGESKAAADGSARLLAARSMASLIRKTRLREVVLDICDCGDMVLETIRRMPTDTPAAFAFSDKHLAKLTEALEKCFELSRTPAYSAASSLVDRHEIECFTAFIFAFRSQQDCILFEGLYANKTPGAQPGV